MPVGPLINTFATLLGALLGVWLRRYLPDGLKKQLPATFGLLSLGMGVMMTAKTSLLPPVILAVLIGHILGEICALEKNIERAAVGVNGYLVRWFPADVKGTEQYYKDFISVLVLFSASGTGIFGAMNEGITHDSTLLVAKAILDFCTALIFATSLGMIVTVTVIPQFMILMGLYFLGRFIMPYTSPELIADFSGCGGIIMMATGLRICQIKQFSIANMLPALLIVMPLSYYWRSWF